MATPKDAKVVVLGISPKEDRYSYMATDRLLGSGYTNLVGVSPKGGEVQGVKVLKAMSEINDEVHTLTVYVGAERLEGMIDEVLKLNPKRIILNPGTENENLEEKAKAQGIEVLRACTLVMLGSSQF